jgi:hypothetical protein
MGEMKVLMMPRGMMWRALTPCLLCPGYRGLVHGSKIIKINVLTSVSVN